MLELDTLPTVEAIDAALAGIKMTRSRLRYLRGAFRRGTPAFQRTDRELRSTQSDLGRLYSWRRDVVASDEARVACATAAARQAVMPTPARPLPPPSTPAPQLHLGPTAYSIPLPPSASAERPVRDEDLVLEVFWSGASKRSLIGDYASRGPRA